jgi:hypothetical protein
MQNMLYRNQVDPVDFNSSNLYWGGTSQGIFKLVSLLNYQKKDDDRNLETLGLSQPVMAGNMYAAKDLLKQPPYLFQVAGSAKEQIIFRSYVSDSFKNKKTDDSYGKPLIKDFNIKIIRRKGISILTFEEINANFIKNKFSAKIITKVDKETISIEFPVNHINIKSESKEWQVETGPILFPISKKKESLFNYAPCFIHFNNFKTMDIFFDYPFSNRGFSLRNKGILPKVPCEIKLFA